MKFYKYHRGLVSSYYTLMAANAEGEYKFIDANGLMHDEPQQDTLYSCKSHLIERLKPIIDDNKAIVVMLNTVYEVKVIE